MCLSFRASLSAGWPVAREGNTLPTQRSCCSVAQSCPTFCEPMYCSPPGSSIHGILQARILEWVAMPSSRRSSGPRDQTRACAVKVLEVKPSFPYLKATSPPWKKPGQAVCRARKDESQEMRLYHDSGHGSGKPRGGTCVIHVCISMPGPETALRQGNKRSQW